MNILLASQSPARARLLKKAKIKFLTVDHGVNEEEIKATMAQHKPVDIAVKLAECKALQAALVNPGSLVIGADQALDFKGKLFNKAKNEKEALEQLKKLSGKEHTLITSTAIALNKKLIWKHLDKSKMKMRSLDDQTIKNYIKNTNKKTLSLVGVYAIEEEGIKLFEKINGDIFSIQGLPMLPLMQFMWDNKILFNKHDR